MLSKINQTKSSKYYTILIMLKVEKGQRPRDGLGRGGWGGASQVRRTG